MPVMATRPTHTITNNFAVAGTCDSTASACELISVLLQKCSRFRFGLLRSSQRQQSAQPLVPQVQACPDEDSRNNGGGISRVADAHVRGHRTAQISGHKNGAEDRGSRNGVNQGRADLQHGNEKQLALGITELVHSLDDLRRAREREACTHGKQQDGDSAEHAPGPDHPSLWRSRHFGSLGCCRHAALPFLITPNYYFTYIKYTSGKTIIQIK